MSDFSSTILGARTWLMRKVHRSTGYNVVSTTSEDIPVELTQEFNKLLRNAFKSLDKDCEHNNIAPGIREELAVTPQKLCDGIEEEITAIIKLIYDTLNTGDYQELMNEIQFHERMKQFANTDSEFGVLFGEFIKLSNEYTNKKSAMQDYRPDSGAFHDDNATSALLESGFNRHCEHLSSKFEALKALCFPSPGNGMHDTRLVIDQSVLR